MNNENVECLRCGYKWYVEDPDSDLPEYCPRCYRKSVSKIPSQGQGMSFSIDVPVKQLFSNLVGYFRENSLLVDLLALSIGIFAMTFVIVYLFA